MKIFITGGTGFVGSHLIRRLLEKNHRVVVVGRRPEGPAGTDNYQYLAADTSRPGTWQEELGDVDAVVNLAGRPVFKIWTARYKQAIYDSRILTTRNLVAGLPADREITLISTSAAGYYGDRGDELLVEGSEPGDDFLAMVCQDWEKAADMARNKGARVAIARFGVVLGKEGGALAQMLTPFKLGLGGSLGDGRQWFPWIGLTDLVDGLLFLLENQECRGAFNFCAPGAVRYNDFARTLARLLKRPALLPAPAFVLRSLLGEFGNSLLCSQRVRPEKLLDSGFVFRHPELDDTLQSILA